MCMCVRVCAHILRVTINNNMEWKSREMFPDSDSGDPEGISKSLLFLRKVLEDTSVSVICQPLAEGEFGQCPQMVM